MIHCYASLSRSAAFVLAYMMKEKKITLEQAIVEMRTKWDGGGAMIHCYASLSRSAAFVLAYMMKEKKITLEQAIVEMRTKWDATWPNDSFVQQLLEYEKELGLQ